MSREHHKNLQRGIKQSIEKREMRPRMSRHGKPMREVYTLPALMGTERHVSMNPKTGEYEVQHTPIVIRAARPMTQDEIQESRKNVLRASDKTGTYGRKNDGGADAGRKAKPSPLVPR